MNVKLIYKIYRKNKNQSILYALDVLLYSRIQINPVVGIMKSTVRMRYNGKRKSNSGAFMLSTVPGTYTGCYKKGEVAIRFRIL